MCDTRTWVFKLLVVFLIIHFSRIRQCRVAATPVGTAFIAGGADAAAGSIDEDSFEITSSPEDTISESQRSTFDATYNNSKTNKDNDGTSSFSSSSSSSLSSSSSASGSIANRLASDGTITDADDGLDADDDDGSNEEFNRSQRKFNNAAEARAGQPKRTGSKTVFGILKRVEDEKDYVGDSASNSLPNGSTLSPWNVVSDDDDEDVDEILQPMTIESDKRRYNSNTGGRVTGPGMAYSMGYQRPTGNDDTDDESSGSNSLKESSVTNRVKSVYPSAFEQHKAYIRNSRRYGHKSHKKKYKDYLHYNPLTTPTTTTATTTTTISPLQRDILARDRIFNSDDIPRPFYQGHMNYFLNTDNDNRMRGEETPPVNFRSYNSPSYSRHHQQHHSGGHLRSGGRYRHGSAQPKNPKPYPDYNMLNYHHLGSRAKQQHQKELEKKIDGYSQYYSKWPHLAQVEDKLFEDEQTDMMYPEGDAIASNPGELVFAAEEDEEVPRKEEEEDDANLPPYIKKYRRRNKQLLDLLEGTQPPSTTAPQWSSSVLKPGPIDGSHQKGSLSHHHRQHRKHHHHREHRNRLRSHRHKNSKWQIEDLFEEQRANPNNPNKTTTYSEDTQAATSSAIGISTSSTTTTSTTTTLSPFDELLKHEDEHIKLLQENQLPAEDVSISRELYDWAVDIGRDHPLSQDNEEDTDYVDHSQSELYSWKTNTNARASKPPTTTTRRPIASVRRPSVYGSIVKSPPMTATTTTKPINSFVYHRVVEAPRAVGAGQTGRKQRLPFVAITDRRLETTKKGVGVNAGELAHKDFEQNHFPMP